MDLTFIFIDSAKDYKHLRSEDVIEMYGFSSFSYEMGICRESQMNTKVCGNDQSNCMRIHQNSVVRFMRNGITNKTFFFHINIIHLCMMCTGKASKSDGMAHMKPENMNKQHGRESSQDTNK